MRTVLVLLASFVCTASARAAVIDPECGSVLARIGDQLVDVNCFHTDDLTTASKAVGDRATTPADNSLAPTALFPAPVPTGAFTPVTDRGTISIAPSVVEGAHAVPGIQLDARYADDSTGEARFLLRLPDSWNGSLVVAGASGTRSEFNGDWAWSDYVLEKGYAYASQNKGILNLKLLFPPPSATPVTPLSCRLNPLSPVWVEFYDNALNKPFTEWQTRILQAARTAREGLKAQYNRYPRHTYAVGTSNGGYQVRRAVEEAPDLFDGGVDWEGTFVDGTTSNILSDLPPAIANWPDYLASGFNPASTAAANIRAAGYPPDIVEGSNANPVLNSLWGRYWTQFWEVTQCQWQKRLDPTWTTYTDGLGNIEGTGGYKYSDRIKVSDVEQNLNAFATTGKIKVPLITVAGTMDALLPIQHQARLYADKVAASRKGNNDQRSAQYRLYEVQNGNHIEGYTLLFPQLELIQRHAQKAFDLLVDHVANGAALPPSQCIPHKGAISATASEGRCAELYVAP